MAPRTRSQARVEASVSLFDELDDDLQRMIVWATTEGGAAKPNAALRGVNKKLRTMVEQTHTWHDEWVDAWMERAELDGKNYGTRAQLEVPGGPNSIEETIKNLAATIKWKVDNGWPQEQAEAYTLITGGLAAPLAAAVRDRSDPDPAVRARSDRYAASASVCDALAERAKQMTERRAAPLLQPDREIRPGDD